MITIDDLINEGKNFEIKIQPEYVTMGINGVQEHHSYQYVDNGDQYFLWLEKCKRFLAANFPNDRVIDDFEKTASNKRGENNHIKLISILEALRDIPVICIKNTPSNMGGATITVNQTQQQNQTQTQSQNFELFMDAIKEHLTLGQFQDLQKIVKENPKKEDAQPKIIEKLKSFGSDVLSNIVANIITSPAIWLGLF